MKENKILYKILKAIYSTLLKTLYRPKVSGIQNIPEEGPIIFVGNHRHAFDPIVVMTYTKRIVHYMAKESIFKGLHGKILEAIGIIKVYRTKSNPVAVSEAMQVLEQGGTIGIFPEGTRNKEKGLLPFKFGAVKMASATGKKIVPCIITGKYKVFKSNIEVKFGEALDISNMDLEKANELLRNKMLEMLEEK